MQYVLAFIGSYLLGSISMAYVFVRQAKGIDIRKEGSGNVGAFNVHFVTGSKFLSIAVGILDGAKGLVAVLVAGWLSGGAFWVQTAALCGALIGHNYPVWLKFHGGRGLATAAMGTLPLGLPGLVVWSIIWIIVYLRSKDILIGNIVAIILTPPILFAIPAVWLAPVVWSNGTPADFALMMTFVSVIHLLRHLDVVKALLEGKTTIG